MVDVGLVATMTVAAVAGGMLGTMIGALHSFILAGIVVALGEAANVAGRNVGQLVEADPATLGAVGITGNLGFGAVLGPHVMFAGAAAATAYAAKQGYMGSNWGYHSGKNIFRGFSPHRLDVLAVGGLFGALGYLVTFTFATVGFPVDPVAISIPFTAVAHRYAFDYPVFGRPSGKHWFDLSPFEREEMTATDGGEGEPAERLTVEPWLPWMYKWRGLVVLGAAGGIFGGITFYVTGSPFLVFGISAATILFLNDGLEDNFGELRITIPITHHITFPGSAAAFAFSGVALSQATPQNIAAAVPLWQVLLVGALFGVFGAVTGEASQRIVYAHSGTHWDPPANAIVLSSLLIAFLAIIGVFPSGGYIPV